MGSRLAWNPQLESPAAQHKSSYPLPHELAYAVLDEIGIAVVDEKSGDPINDVGLGLHLTEDHDILPSELIASPSTH